MNELVPNLHIDLHSGVNITITEAQKQLYLAMQESYIKKVPFPKSKMLSIYEEYGRVRKRSIYYESDKYREYNPDVRSAMKWYLKAIATLVTKNYFTLGFNVTFSF